MGSQPRSRNIFFTYHHQTRGAAMSRRSESYVALPSPTHLPQSPLGRHGELAPPLTWLSRWWMRHGKESSPQRDKADSMALEVHESFLHIMENMFHFRNLVLKRLSKSFTVHSLWRKPRASRNRGFYIQEIIPCVPRALDDRPGFLRQA